MSDASIFGKLPAHGDFVARGLSGDERDRIDRWLSASLTDARTAYGDAFDGRYDQAVPWRFLRRDDQGWTSGAIAMSMDAAGRRFPLYAHCAGVSSDHRAAAIAVRVEEALYRAIAERWTIDATMAALVEIDADTADDPWSVGDDELGEGWRATDTREVAAMGSHPCDLATRMLAGSTA